MAMLLVLIVSLFVKNNFLKKSEDYSYEIALTGPAVGLVVLGSMVIY
jgi:hypothetical protein